MTIDFNDPEVAKAIQEKIDEETRALKLKVEQTIGEKKALQDKLSGIDPDKYKELLEAHQQKEAEEEQRRNHEIETKKDFQALQQKLEQTVEAKNKVIAELEKKSERLSNTLYEHVAKVKLHEAIVKQGGIPELLMPHLMPRVRVAEDESGDFRAEVLNGGQPMFNQKGEPAGIEDLVKEYKANDLYAPVFKADVKPGTGATGNLNGHSAPSPDNPWAKNSLNHSMQAFLEKTKPDEARRLKAQAGISD